LPNLGGHTRGRLLRCWPLQRDKFGVYLIPDDNPAIEYHFIGGCRSVEEAKTRLQEIANRPASIFGAGFNAAEVEFRERQKVATDNTLELLTEKELGESIREHYDRALGQMTKSKAIKAFLSYGNCIFLLTAVAIWLFWTHSSFTVPKSLDLPLVGNRLDGITLNRETVARYFPLALFALYLVKFGVLLRTNLENDLLRRKVLTLVIHHSWRVQQFAILLTSIRKSMEKNGLGWLVNVSDWMHDLNPGSLGNLRQRSAVSTRNEVEDAPSSTEPTPNANQAMTGTVRAELDQRLADWIPDEFDRRMHSLYFLDKEREYSRFAICFDPVLYVVSLNRIVFRVYEFLRGKGIPIDEINAPQDPYLVQRVVGPMVWILLAGHVLIFGGVMGWSFLVAGASSKLLLLANILAMAAVLIVPNVWNYLALVRRRGFPKMEPLGAYTVGPMTPNHLSLL